MPWFVLLLALACAPRASSNEARRGEADCTVVLWGYDADGDGWGRPGNQLACESPGEGWTTQLADCDDTDPAVHAKEWWFRDRDGDGWGGTFGREIACGAPDSDYVLASGDCDDHSATTYPGAPEACQVDGRDEDCDGTPTAYLDEDGDGYGTDAVRTCDEPRAAASGDCDDADPSLSPAALEICGDAVDQDCDGNAGRCGPQGVWRLWEHDAVVENGQARGGDLDGDGLTDLLLHRDDGGTNAHLGPFDRSRRLDAQAALVVGSSVRNLDAWLADADGDGRDDVVVGVPGTSSADTWIESTDKQGTIVAWTAEILVVGAFPRVVLDGDGDGVDEIGLQYPHASSWRLAFVEDLPDGSWTAGDRVSAWLDEPGGPIDLGDVNGDGLSDLAWSTNDGVRVAYGPLAGEIVADDALAGPSDGHLPVEPFAAGDLDGDGLRDLAIRTRPVGEYEYRDVLVHLGPFAADVESPDAKLETSNVGLVAEAGDLDGDGVGELLVDQGGCCEGSGSAQAWILTGPWEGALTLTSPLAELVWRGENVSARSAVAADLDGDGLGDLAVSSGSHTYLLFGGPGF